MDEPNARAVEPLPEQRVDPLLYRLVVGALGLALLCTVTGGLILTGMGQDIPEGLIALGAASVGALGGMLAPKG